MTILETEPREVQTCRGPAGSTGWGQRREPTCFSLQSRRLPRRCHEDNQTGLLLGIRDTGPLTRAGAWSVLFYVALWVGGQPQCSWHPEGLPLEAVVLPVVPHRPPTLLCGDGEMLDHSAMGETMVALLERSGFPS